MTKCSICYIILILEKYINVIENRLLILKGGIIVDIYKMFGKFLYFSLCFLYKVVSFFFKAIAFSIESLIDFISDIKDRREEKKNKESEDSLIENSYKFDELKNDNRQSNPTEYEYKHEEDEPIRRSSRI